MGRLVESGSLVESGPMAGIIVRIKNGPFYEESQGRKPSK